MSWPWNELEIAPGSDRDTIRRGYARKLKRTNPEDDPDGFKRLRAAYDTALQHVKWQHIEPVESEEAPDHAEDSPVAAAPESGSDTPDSPRPSVGRQGWQPLYQDAAEAALRAERQQDFADLEARLAELAAALEGPWAGDARQVEALFIAVMQSPALMELGVREQVEARIAALAASTIPHGDALIEPAAKAFGWFRLDPHTWHGPALDTVLNRIEEWRIVEQLGQSSHPLHLGWQALTRAPAPAWRWRLDAGRPNVARQVRSLLGLDGTKVADGLKHSFNKDAVARWQAYLAKPRLTLGMLALVPVIALLAGIAGVAAGPPGAPAALVIWVAGAVVALASPLIPFLLVSHWRERWLKRSEENRSRWPVRSWIFGFPILCATGGLVLLGNWALIPFTIACALFCVWGAVVRRETPAPVRLRAVAFVYLLFPAFFLLPTLGAFPAVSLYVMLAVLAIWLYVQIAAFDEVGGALRNIVIFSGAIVPIVVIVISLGAAIGLRGGTTLPLNAVFFLYFLVALPLLLALAGASRWVTEQGAIVFQRVARILICLTLIGLTPFPNSGSGTSATSAPTLNQRITGALSAPDARQAIRQLRHARTGFSEIAGTNPILWGKIEDDVNHVYTGGTYTPINVAVLNIQSQILDAYHANLKYADRGMLDEEVRVELARLESLQSLWPDACASRVILIENTALPPQVEARVSAQIFNVAAVPPIKWAPWSEGIDRSDEILSRTANALDISEGELSRRLEREDGTQACDARLALVRMLASYPDVDMAATLRANPQFIR